LRPIPGANSKLFVLKKQYFLAEKGRALETSLGRKKYKVNIAGDLGATVAIAAD